MAPLLIGRLGAAVTVLAVVCLRSPAGTAQRRLPEVLPANTSFATTRAAEVLSDARHALSQSPAVTSVLAVGRSRRVFDSYTVLLETELSLELPRRYVRRQWPSRAPGDAARFGFEGTRLIDEPGPAIAVDDLGNHSLPAALTVPARFRLTDHGSFKDAQAEATALALGFFAKPEWIESSRFSYGGRARAAGGFAHVLMLIGEDGQALRLLIDERTSLPLMVTSGSRHMYFSDYAEAGGARLPYRIRRAIGSETIEEITITQFRLDPRPSVRRP